ncbi:hypothetical protein Sste5346_007089 [Sporothrix stenoceras]|uniref:Enoyl reductase (ER) domain-containing protein n=1 Tax=Sporothrix stenoceras TaxID=5173 RepID=A0ABR3YVJ1_9PEZI
MPSFTVFKGSKEGVKKSTTTKPDELKGDQVLLRVTVSGLCGTDLHYKEQDMVLGHEGSGVVEAVGPEVKNLAKGDRVGWGYQTDACGACQQCLTGHETYCAGRNLYGYHNFDQGSFASGAVWREAFLHKLPDNLSDEAAAPLQCGGATVYAALQGLEKPGVTVGVLGVGGLGHLAIQFAAKMGCRVVVLSGSSAKREQALQLGAHKFVATNEGQTLGDDGEGWTIDRLLVTSSVQPKWDSLLPMMSMRSQIYPLSVSHTDLVIPYLPLIAMGITIQGSLVADRSVHREMLQFAALQGVKPITETFPMTEAGISEAIGKLEDGKMIYRGVLIPAN